MKGYQFKEGKGNVDSFHDEENGYLYFRVNLNAEELPVSNSSGRTMMAKGFINFTHGDSRVFGNLNLNIGVNKAQVIAQNKALADRIAELEAENAKLLE